MKGMSRRLRRRFRVGLGRFRSKKAAQNRRLPFRFWRFEIQVWTGKWEKENKPSRALSNCRSKSRNPLIPLKFYRISRGSKNTAASDVASATIKTPPQSSQSMCFLSAVSLLDFCWFPTGINGRVVDSPAGR